MSVLLFVIMLLIYLTISIASILFAILVSRYKRAQAKHPEYNKWKRLISKGLRRFFGKEDNFQTVSLTSPVTLIPLSYGKQPNGAEKL